jgi:hypothetical protein
MITNVSHAKIVIMVELNINLRNTLPKYIQDKIFSKSTVFFGGGLIIVPQLPPNPASS